MDPIKLAEASRIAEGIVELLAPACDSIVVAGSIRRRKPLVKDVEIVCTPRMVPPLGELIPSGGLVSAIDERIERLVRLRSLLGWNLANPANGPRYKRLMWGSFTKIDLFIVLPPASWGALLAIRTGPAEFSRLLVTRREHGGAMPDGLHQAQGSLHGPAGPLETPEEEDFFRALGLPCWLPSERSAYRLQDFLRLERIRENAGSVT